MKKHTQDSLTATEDDVFVFPASFAQQRLWFLSQLQESSAIYNIPSALHLTGTLNIKALEKAVNAVVQRHEVLRSSFQIHNNSLVQIISPEANLNIVILDLRSQPSTEQIEHLATLEAQLPFDLKTSPLVRVTILQLKEESHVLLVTMHHIISDAWSTEIFIREITTLYQAFTQGKPSPLEELTIQYADFAHWQRQYLSGQVLETQLNYWQKQLANSPPLLELPSDRTRPAVQSFAGSTEQFQLDKQLTIKLISLSHSSGTTLFMTLLAAFATLLARYSNQEDIVIGSPIANRNRREIEPLIGFFVNTLVLRSNLQGNPTFVELLSRVKQVAMDAYAHQDVPFEQLVEALQPERSLSHNPLFQVMFSLQNAPIGKLEVPGLTLIPLEIANVTAKFDLLLSMAETEDGLTGAWEYNSDLFDADTIKRMIGHFQTLLLGIVSNPSCRIDEFPLLVDLQRQQLLVEWNDTEVEYGFECIHNMFATQVELTPDAVAVVYEQQQLTYRQLNERANQLAHYLQKMGVGADVLVGICMERSLEMAVGVLGVLKAGGAYVPIDPQLPQERLAWMLEDTCTGVLLTQNRLLLSLPVNQGRLVCLDADWEVISQESKENPVSAVNLDNLVYVIYTSGSTGKPKGIALPHRALSNLCQWHLANLKTGVGVLQFASLSFDASIHEMFAAWCSGGTLFMIPENLRLDVKELIYFLAHKPIQKVILPVVVLQQLAEMYGQEKHLFQNIKEAIATGEQLQINLPIINLFKQLEDCSLHNHYGPSETHVVTALTLSKLPDEWRTYPPVGKPIANTQIYILDNHLKPVPIGVIGELYIGGVNLARGYFNRPELTSQKFIPNPFGNEPGSRLYKTGDLARYLSDGNIEFLGRIDHQAKIRGFRVELGEIESVLNKHPQVNQAIVTIKVETTGEKRLISYIVLQQDQTITTLELRQFLQQKLPDYMIPAAFVRLAALPLTHNGKVDRTALPEPDENSYVLNEIFVAPRTPAEELLVEIWIELLGIEKIGIYDNFFNLGGHSLLATQMIGRISQAFYLEITLRDLFENPTVTELVEVMAKLTGGRELIDEIATTSREINQLSPEEVKAALETVKENS
ncbi:non-ribosomal peptide synthetase [Nostoc sp. WHI]|uniref:non-ribosomal peptide synthetase n=1 Tax=Nostoc sp. WHI TaxID=2650611 RepID=UPI0018C4CDDF|nr:non-ribosomal peptide synthetase [Nostoc sp. WHI]MBG1266526.1 amino acid adenylation domain-containing protein [Nostoc sp. WHI]